MDTLLFKSRLAHQKRAGDYRLLVFFKWTLLYKETLKPSVSGFLLNGETKSRQLHVPLSLGMSGTFKNRKAIMDMN